MARKVNANRPWASWPRAFRPLKEHLAAMDEDFLIEVKNLPGVPGIVFDAICAVEAESIVEETRIRRMDRYVLQTNRHPLYERNANR